MGVYNVAEAAGAVLHHCKRHTPSIFSQRVQESMLMDASVVDEASELQRKPDVFDSW